MSLSYDFAGKVVLVTGSSCGIGEEIAVLFSQHGAKVVVTGSKDYNKIMSVVEKCDQESPYNLKALGVKCDMSIDADIQELVNKVISKFGRLDVLVNNAGLAGFGYVDTPSVMTQFDMTMKINLRAPFFLTHLLTPYLIDTRGSIINISSSAALHPVDLSPVYCASKAGLDMLTKCLAVYLGPKGVRVNIVYPSLTHPANSNESASTTKTKPKEGKVTWKGKGGSAKYPKHRNEEASEVAKLVLSLASKNTEVVA